MIIVGAKYISELLNVSHKLQVFWVSENNIGDDGIAVISEALQHTKSLTILMVWQCGLSAKGSYCSKYKMHWSYVVIY